METSFLSLLHLESNNALSWEANISLAAWQDFQLIQSTQHSEDSEEDSDHTISLFVNRDPDQTVPSEQQTEAYTYLITHQEQIRDAILEKLLENYDDMCEVYDYDPEDAAEWMPPVQTVSDFKPLISPLAVIIHQVHKDGVAYVGFEFECTWDNEHGMGVMTHLQRIVEIGGADAAILSWIATHDTNEESNN